MAERRDSGAMSFPVASPSSHPDRANIPSLSSSAQNTMLASQGERIALRTALRMSQRPCPTTERRTSTPTRDAATFRSGTEKSTAQADRPADPADLLRRNRILLSFETRTTEHVASDDANVVLLATTLFIYTLSFTVLHNLAICCVCPCFLFPSSS